MKKNIIPFIMFISLISGCKDFVEIGVPDNKLVTASVFQYDGHAIAALTNIYGQMSSRNMAYNIPLYTGIIGDELTNYSTNGTAVQAYQNGMQPLDAITNNIWDSSYNFIYLANAVIEGCEQSSNLSTGVKRQLMAEARFIRAFWYLYLVNLYGDVPLLTSTDYQTNARAKRSPANEVYVQINADLEQAVSNLNIDYVSETSVTTTTDRIRPNQFAARALLARAYLYEKNWAKAEEYASSVINNTTNYDIVALADPFKKNNKEAIWQLPRPNNASNLATIEGQYFSLTARPGVSLSNCTALSPQQLVAFGTGDLRASNWIGSYKDVSVNPNVIYYFPNKYKERSNTSYIEYSTPLRLAEQYLIRAEARAEQNNLSGAQTDLNKVRARTGTGNTNASTQDQLLSAVIDERQKELFIEWGHRWIDLKRTDRIDVVMPAVAASKGGSTWNTNKRLFPIPQKDIEANRALIQNLGYN